MKKIVLVSILAALASTAANADDDSYITVQTSNYKNSTVRVGHVTNSKLFILINNVVYAYLAGEAEVGRERFHIGPALHLTKSITSNWDGDFVVRYGAGVTTKTPVRQASFMGSVGIMLVNTHHQFGIEIGVRKVNSLAPTGYLSSSIFF